MLPCTSRFHHLAKKSHPETNRMRQSVGYALSVLIGAPAVLGAQGFGIYELGSCGMGRAGTGVAAPCGDGSAIFFNPAGLAGLTGWHISGGGTLIKAVGNSTRDSTLAKTDLANVHLEASHTKVTGGHFGAIAKVSDRFSIGARFLMHAEIDYAGTATFTQVPTGVIIPTTVIVGPDTIPAGTPLDAVLQGLGVFTGLLPNQAVTTTITNPEQFVVGVSYKPMPGWTLYGDYQYTWWGTRFAALPINFSNPATPSLLLNTYYQNTSDFRLGAEWVKNAKLTLRGGYLYNTAAAPPETVTPLLPEGARNELTAGAGVALSPKWSVDFAYQFIKQNDRRGRTRDISGATSGQLLELNNGLYSFSAHLVGFSLAYTF